MIGAPLFAMANRITIFSGHYGSGKTNIAVNYALQMKRSGVDVSICDLDIVNPYFRTKDSMDELNRFGIALISSPYANTNVDIPSLPQEMYAIVDDRSKNYVIDLGGDDRGALAMGRLTPRILEENDYAMLMVVNLYRPLTGDVDSLCEIKAEIESASGISFTGVINNSNLGDFTEPGHILVSHERVLQFCEKVGLPLVMTTVRDDLVSSLKDQINQLFPLKLQSKYY